MGHVKYNKIHRLGKDEVEGILDGEVIIQEKIDGANASIWIEDDGLAFGSRNHKVDEFNGLKEYTIKHSGINGLLSDHPEYRLFGEWLVKHTIAYNETAYRHFYLFDILDEEFDVFLDPEVVKEFADIYEIKRPEFHGKGIFTEEQLQEFVGKSVLGDKGEGIVIKRHGFTDKFGESPRYAKIVTQNFKENNAITFGGNDKHSETYWEQYICNEYMSVARVRKVMQKIESADDVKCDLSHTPRVTMVSFHDMITEEIWAIQKKCGKIDFNSLRRICMKKAQQIYKDILNDSLGVADEK